ncbi:MAG: hypothetical protein ACRCUE_09000 [Bosea sp. (in: a-proteobacteria)]
MMSSTSAAASYESAFIQSSQEALRLSTQIRHGIKNVGCHRERNEAIQPLRHAESGVYNEIQHRIASLRSQ